MDHLTPNLRCQCGMDLLLSSGNARDRANCTQCTWTAGGTYAEHAGTHHWLDTGHRWTLTPFTPEATDR